MNIKSTNINNKTYSFRRRIFILFFAVILSFLLIFAWIATYFTQTLREKTYESVRDTLEVYNQQLSHNLDKLHTFMFDMSEYSLDMLEVFSNKELETIYNRIIRSKELLDYSIPSFTEIEGMFLYAPINDTFIHSFEYHDGSDVGIFLKNKFRSSDDFSDIKIDGWYSELISGDYYLLRIIQIHDSFIGTWAKVSRLTAIFEDISDLDGNVLYVGQDGYALSNELYTDTRFPVEMPIDTYHIIDTPKGKALLVMNELDYCDYYLAAVIPLQNIDRGLSTLYRLLAILSVLMLTFSAILMFWVNRFLSQPIRMLENAAVRMRDGNFDQKLPEDMSNCQEIIDIDQAYNRMIDEIQHLQIDIYEEKIAKSEIELNYLKSQMAPHFLINCLFSIMTLANDEGNNKEVLHQMIEALAGHLRYTLSDQTTVTLKKELAYVKNYIELTQLRFPGCLSYIEEIDPAIKMAGVFPLMLLMFTENSIKYNLVMGEELEIKIIGKLIEENNSNYIHLIHIDSGDGFGQELLDNYDSFLKNFNKNIIYKNDSTHIGIPNVAKRLKIVYGDEASIHFSNQKDSGARIDLKIPYTLYEKDGTL